MSLSGEDSHRRIRSEFPYLVEKCSTVTIVLDDNIKLAGTLWIPKSLIHFGEELGFEKIFVTFLDKNEELIKEEKFATILEYLPYRKADWTFVFKTELFLKKINFFRIGQIEMK
jgi:hypothetical protein